MNIDYLMIAKAISYYKNVGYSYLEVPWIVSKKALSITCPLNLNLPDNRFPVASGEQSFLEMIIKKELTVGRYSCATPCIREHDNLNDGIHFPQFFKVELIDFFGEVSTEDFKEKYVEMEINLDRMLYSARKFMPFRLKGPLRVEKTTDELRQGCDTLVSYDILSHDKVELGSYGIRKIKNADIYWIYGTGAALPRLARGCKLNG